MDEEKEVETEIEEEKEDTTEYPLDEKDE